MPPRRWTMARRQPLTPALAHFLACGCYHGPTAAGGVDFEVFLLAGTVCRGRLDPLRALWATHGQDVKAQDGRGPSYAECMLAGAAWRWPGQPWRCAAHREGPA